MGSAAAGRNQAGRGPGSEGGGEGLCEGGGECMKWLIIGWSGEVSLKVGVMRISIS